MIISIVRKK